MLLFYDTIFTTNRRSHLSAWNMPEPLRMRPDRCYKHYHSPPPGWRLSSTWISLEDSRLFPAAGRSRFCELVRRYFAMIYANALPLQFDSIGYVHTCVIYVFLSFRSSMPPGISRSLPSPKLDRNNSHRHKVAYFWHFLLRSKLISF